MPNINSFQLAVKSRHLPKVREALKVPFENELCESTYFTSSGLMLSILYEKIYMKESRKRKKFSLERLFSVQI